MILHYKNIPIHFTDQGTGNVVVLLHGFLENSSMWTALIPGLSKDHRIICIDLLGHGKTGCLGYIHTMESMAECVEVVISYLQIATITLVGHSMGGYVALAYADLFPEKTEGICLMNSSALGDDTDKQKNRDRAILAVKQNHRTFIGISITNLFAPMNRKKFEREIADVIEEGLKLPVQGIIAALEGMKIRKNRESILEKRDLKKMMVIGLNDGVLDYTKLIQQSAGRSVEIVELSGGHMSHIEDYEELAYNIIRFIEK